MSDDAREINWLLSGVVIGLIVGLVIGFVKMHNSWQRESVNLKHAEYYLDQNYTRQWRWRTNCIHDVWIGGTNIILPNNLEFK